MPLNNKLTPELSCMMKELSYQDKVNIYDRKCRGCGYIYIKVGNRILRSIEEAIDISAYTGLDITRSCDYPDDVEEHHGEIVYPSLTEIVCNGCQFWNMKTKGEGCADRKIS